MKPALLLHFSDLRVMHEAMLITLIATTDCNGILFLLLTFLGKFSPKDFSEKLVLTMLCWVVCPKLLVVPECGDTCNSTVLFCFRFSLGILKR